MPKKINTNSVESELSSSAFFSPQIIKPKNLNKSEKLPAITRISDKDSMLTSYQNPIIEKIRKSVKDLGKEVTFVRLTENEKDRLIDLVHLLKKKRKDTSENEVARIALNYLLDEYDANKNESILSKVIDALLA